MKILGIKYIIITTEHKGIDIQNESCVLDVNIIIFEMLYYITYYSLT